MESGLVAAVVELFSVVKLMSHRRTINPVVAVGPATHSNG
jgi:hypothetical protein